MGNFGCSDFRSVSYWLWSDRSVKELRTSVRHADCRQAEEHDLKKCFAVHNSIIRVASWCSGNTVDMSLRCRAQLSVATPANIFLFCFLQVETKKITLLGQCHLMITYLQGHCHLLNISLQDHYHFSKISLQGH